MSRSLLFRLQAAGWHLLGSLLVITVFMVLVYGYWYAAPYDMIFSTGDVVKVLVGVDLVLGPMITLVIFNVLKSRKELIRDLGVILTIQIVALAWGTQVAYSVRPQYLAFVGSNVYAVTGRDINVAELPEDIKQRAWYQLPVPVSVQGPQSQAEWGQHMADLYNEKVPDLMYQTRRYRPYAERTQYSNVPALTAQGIFERGATQQAWLEQVQAMEGAADFEFYTIMSGTFTSLAAVRKTDGVLISVMPVQPVPPPGNKS